MPKIREPGTRPEKNTAEEQRQSITAAPKYDGKIKPGEIRNPLGKPPGTRVELTKAFFSDLAAIWREKGIAALEELALTDRATFVRVCASVMPKEIEIDAEHRHYGVSDKLPTAEEWAVEIERRNETTTH